ncbi:MAG: DNA mismatch repair protein MutS [Deltaproteobacteria bacterium]|nr:MAG: DNA mismatch repair protein MutS [Deltaproteobacteria bacterium]HEC31526.1 DNA mismatch repair protein MutS [Deltaproteobacteria bacterium]
MTKKAPGSTKRRIDPSSDRPLFYSPFKDLDRKIAKAAKAKSEAKRESSDVAMLKSGLDNEDAIFREEMKDVIPLKNRRKRRFFESSCPKPPRFFVQEEDAEALAKLAELVAGYGKFDLTFSDEYVEGGVAGLNPIILSKLRNGDFSYQDFVDLHGLNKTEAREKVARFLHDSARKGYRCVLIVHGRGLHSDNKEPVIKSYIKTWLCKGEIGKMVLAFSSARPCDGGTGALYVLLRKKKFKL